METEKLCAGCHNKLCIQKVPIFSSLGQEDLHKIYHLIQHKTYKKGEFIFQAGDKLDSMIIINEGSAKAVRYSQDGREQILHVFLEGDFLGEKSLFSNENAPYFVEVLKDMKVCILKKELFRSLIYEYPEFSINIIQELGNRMEQLESTIKSMGVRSVDARIGELLLEYARNYGKPMPDGTLIPLPLSREGIANYLCIARETLSRKLGILENEGIIKSIGNKNILLLKEEDLRLQSGTE